MDDYKYTLNYQDRDEKVTFEFPADLSIWTLIEKIKRFMLACGWYEAQLDKVFKGEDEE